MFKLKGVVPPMITPFEPDGQLDLHSLETLVNFLKDKVDGLFICGSYGSGPLMSVEERKKVADTVKKVIKDTIPVVVHAGTTNTRDTVELIKHAEKIGCDCCAAVAPYYFHHNEDSVIEFYSQMIKSVSSHFPVYVYYNPKFSGYSISLDTMRKLKDIGIHGVKDASFDILVFATLMRELGSDNFDIVLGTEAMWLSARALGCEAYIPGLGNAFPEICHMMYEEGMSNNIEQCRKTQFQVNELRDVMYLAKSTQLAIYTMLELRGVIKAYPRSPFIPAKEKEKREIEVALKEMGVL
ncbi:MAG: dihydrodipicolinate synthase family protein [Spirochaetes bacterium]|nr:dihydrodipicolinate synthase family protein [Spirochaetota bacterium]